MVISQINEFYGTVTGKAHKCKDNAATCITESFSKMLTGFVSNETDPEGGEEASQLIGLLKPETDQASNEDQSGNDSLTHFLYMPSDIYSNNLNGLIVHNMSLGKSDGYDELNLKSDKYPGIEGNDLLEEYEEGHAAQLRSLSESVNVLPSKTETKKDLQNQPAALSDSEEGAYSLHSVNPEDIMLNESIASKGSEYSSKKRYHSSDVERPIIESSVYESQLLKTPKKAWPTAQAAEYVKIADIGTETKAFKEPQQGVRFIFGDKYKEVLPNANGFTLAYESGDTLIPEETKLKGAENSDRPIENLKELLYLSEDGLEVNSAKSKHSSYFGGSSGSSGEERLWDQNSSSAKIDSSFKTALFQTSYPFEPFLQIPEVIDKITTKEDILTVVAERLTVMSGEGRAELEIKIHPENLGKLLLKVVNENGLYSAQITAETSHVKELLQSHLNDLRASLKEQGFDFIRLDVDLSNSQNSNRQWAWQDRFLPGRNNYGSFVSGLSSQTVERVEGTYNRHKATGHIDCLV